MNETDKLATLICESKKIVAFTGAGISTESGVPDYRSQGGLWEEFRPVTYQEFLDSEEKREKYWNYKFQFMEKLKETHPNEGHKALVFLEKKKKLKGLITQNIDGLHTRAGTSKDKLIEIHGTNLETLCIDCLEIKSWEEAHERVRNGDKAPKCHQCQGPLKPNTISFGQNLDTENLTNAFDWAKNCDLLIALGSTLVVEPAASIPAMAKQYGAKLVIVTLSTTPLDSFADLKITAEIGKTLTEALKKAWP